MSSATPAAGPSPLDLLRDLIKRKTAAAPPKPAIATREATRFSPWFQGGDYSPDVVPFLEDRPAEPGQILPNALKQMGMIGPSTAALAGATLRYAGDVIPTAVEGMKRLAVGDQTGLGESVAQLRRPIDAAAEMVGQQAKQFASDPAGYAMSNPLDAVAGVGLAGDIAARPASALLREAADRTTGGISTAARTSAELATRIGQEGLYRAAGKSALESLESAVPFVKDAMDSRRATAAGRAAAQGPRTDAYSWRNNRIRELMRGPLSGLDDVEHEQAIRIMTGLQDLPPDASPALKNAVDYLYGWGDQRTTDLIQKRLLSPEDAFMRAYQPMRIERFANELERVSQGGPLAPDAAGEAVGQWLGTDEGAAWRAQADQTMHQRPLERPEFVDAAQGVEEMLQQARSEAPLSSKSVADRRVGQSITRTRPFNLMRSEWDALPPGLQRRRAKRYGVPKGSADPYAWIIEHELRKGTELPAEVLRQNETWTRMAAQGGLKAILTQTDQLAAQLQQMGRRAPVYYPYLDDPRYQDWLAAPSTRRYKPGVLKHSVGSRYATGDYVKDVRLAVLHADWQIKKYGQAEETIKRVLSDPAIGARVYKPGEKLPSNMTTFSPDGFLLIYRHKLSFGKKVVDMLEELRKTRLDDGVYDDAMAAAIRDQLDSGKLDATVAGIARAKQYVVPRAAIRGLQETYPDFGVAGRIYDHGTGWWKRVVLARPAFVLNNAVGNTVFVTLQGAAPKHWLRAAQMRWRAKISEVAPDLASEGLTAQEQQLTHLGQAQDEAAGKLMSWLETRPVFKQIGSLQDRLFAWNSEVEAYWRRVSFLKAADRVADKGRFVGAGNRMIRAIDKLDDLDALGPDHIEAALSEVKFFMNDYQHIPIWERTWLRRLLPFGSFTKHALRLVTRLPLEYPGRALILNELTHLGSELVADDNAKLPDRYRNRGLVDTGIEFDLTTAAGPRHVRLWWRTAGMNPLNVGSTFNMDERSSWTGQPEDLVRGMAGGLNPVLKWGVGALTPGRDPATGMPYQEMHTIEDSGHYYRLASETPIEQWRGRVVRELPGGLVEVTPPGPSLAEQLANVPPVQALRGVINPNARESAHPLSLEGREVLTSPIVKTWWTELARHLAPGSPVLIDTQAVQLLRPDMTPALLNRILKKRYLEDQKY